MVLVVLVREVLVVKYFFAIILFVSSLAYSQVTPNLGLQLPPRGFQNWDVAMNSNFSTIDSAVGALQITFRGAWSGVTTYSRGQQVTFGSALYVSTINNNINHEPDLSPSQWTLIFASSSPTGWNFIPATDSHNANFTHTLTVDRNYIFPNQDGTLVLGISTVPLSVSGNGTNGLNTVPLIAGVGGATSGTTGQTAGKGGDIVITSGQGGNASSGSTNGTGGNIIVTSGDTGSGSGTAGRPGFISFLIGSNTTPVFRADDIGVTIKDIGNTASVNVASNVASMSAKDFSGNFSLVNVTPSTGVIIQAVPNTNINLVGIDGFVNVVDIVLGGNDNTATPNPQKIRGTDAQGTDLTGGVVTLRSGASTGAANPSLLQIDGSSLGNASGLALAPQIHRIIINDVKSLTSGSATSLLSLPLASGQMGGGTIIFYIEATNGTNKQCTLSGEFTYAGENTSGVFVTNTSILGTPATACTSGNTLSSTFSLTGSNPALLQVTPTLTGFTPSRFSVIYEIHHMGQTQPTP